MKVSIASFTIWSICINLIFWALSNDTTSTIGLQVGRNHALLSPNIGLHWYLFMNLFGRCRQFFVVVTKGLPFVLIIPLSIRFFRYPIALVSAVIASTVSWLSHPHHIICIVAGCNVSFIVFNFKAAPNSS